MKYEIISSINNVNQVSQTWLETTIYYSTIELILSFLFVHKSRLGFMQILKFR